jgi:hypothetical protein
VTDIKKRDNAEKEATFSFNHSSLLSAFPVFVNKLVVNEKTLANSGNRAGSGRIIFIRTAGSN